MKCGFIDCNNSKVKEEGEDCCQTCKERKERNICWTCNKSKNEKEVRAFPSLYHSSKVIFLFARKLKELSPSQFKNKIEKLINEWLLKNK